MRVINKNQIIQLYSQDKYDFIHSSECVWRLWKRKGDEIFSFFPTFRKPKHYKEDLFMRLFSGDVCNRKEMNEKIRKCYDFEEYYLFEQDGIIYVKPRVVISLPDECMHKYFNTLEECENYIAELQQSNDFLITIE